MVKNNKANSENYLLMYKTSSNMLISYGETLWTKFSGLLVANSILLGLISFILRSTNDSEIITGYQYYYLVVISVLGIVISILGFILIIRSFDYYNFWLFMLRDIENKYFNLKIFNESIIFGNGNKVSVINPSENNRYQMCPLGRMFRMRTIFCAIILLFTLLFIVILILIFIYNKDIFKIF